MSRFDQHRETIQNLDLQLRTQLPDLRQHLREVAQNHTIVHPHRPQAFIQSLHMHGYRLSYEKVVSPLFFIGTRFRSKFLRIKLGLLGELLLLLRVLRQNRGEAFVFELVDVQEDDFVEVHDMVKGV